MKFFSFFKKGGATPELKETITEESVEKTNPLMRAKEAFASRLSKTPDDDSLPIEKESLPPVQESIVEDEERAPTKPIPEEPEVPLIADEEDMRTKPFSPTKAASDAEELKKEIIVRKLRALAPQSQPTQKTQDGTSDVLRTSDVPSLKTKEKPHAVPRQQINPIVGPKKVLIRPLRTYKDDIIEAIRQKKASLVTIAAAEQNERAKKAPLAPEPPSRELRGKIMLVGISAALVVAGAASIVFFFFSGKTDVATDTLGVTSLVFSELEKEFDMTGLVGEDLLRSLDSEVRRTNITLNTIQHLYVTKSTLVGKTLANAQEFFDALQSEAPGSLARSFEPVFMAGVHAFDGNQPLLVFKTRSFDAAFAGMLNWETRMSADLSPLFGPPVTRSLIVTPEGTRLPTPNNAAFVDTIIKSRDTRVLFDERGKIALIYAFLDRNTLVITTNPNTFEEIFTRIASTRISK